MNIVTTLGCLLLFFFSAVSPSSAGGAAANRGQMQHQQQLMMQKAVQQRMIQQRMAAQQAAAVRQQAVAAAVTSAEVRDIATLQDVLRALEQDSRAWALIIDRQAKAVVVQQYILRYQQEGVRIAKDPAYYADLIDGMAVQNPQLLNNPFADVLKMAAVLEYDFENGQSKDQMALQILGSYQAVEENKKRLRNQ